MDHICFDLDHQDDLLYLKFLIKEQKAKRDIMRIAFIGLGSIAQKHITAIKKIDANAILFAVRHNTNAPSVKGIKNIPFASLASLNLDAIILSNPSVYHETILLSI